jgi:hypothetical protein
MKLSSLEKLVNFAWWLCLLGLGVSYALFATQADPHGMGDEPVGILAIELICSLVMLEYIRRSLKRRRKNE